MKFSIKYAVVLILVGVGLIWYGLSSINSEPPKLALPEDLKGVIVDSPPAILPSFTLKTNKGREFSNKDLQGGWTLAFFGYTHCPDVCPTSLRVLDKVSNMPDLPEKTKLLFVSVDPGRDSVEVMNDFVTYFNENIIGLTGDKSEIDKLAQTLGVIYDYEGDVASGTYTVNHVASVYLIDPKGRERAYVLPPHDEKRLMRAFKLISDYYQ